ncbi:MAG: diaminopimelate epimerase [Chitinivibrionales bacterium]|nr:diaminopimelate epimerase [Chitinivibrionales bacterium]
MQFVKMEGCANDFIVSDDLDEGDIPGLVRRAPGLCDRRRGIGADGIIGVLHSSRADVAMRIINADGSEPEMCGNGIRCVALFCRRKGLSDRNALSIETAAGLIKTEFIGDQVRVNMGTPILAAREIPVARDSGETVIMEKLPVGDRTFYITAVSMGNPHAVIYADALTDELVLTYGKQIESHPFFPKKTNVEFIAVRSPAELDMRVYERGCGETMACGTGACAAVVAGVLNKKNGKAVTVHLRGGDLFIEWDGQKGSPVYMTGPAQWVFEGSITL